MPPRGMRRPPVPNAPKHRINEQIRISPVRVVGADGEQVGVISTDQALTMARDVGLDLVEVAPEARPPVCRIMDFGKFKYQISKRSSKSASHQQKIKEIRVRPKTGDHDIEVKVNRARNFLKHKDKVQITVLFKGREMAHQEEGQRIIEQIVESLADVSKVESEPRRSGRRMECRLAPK